MGNTELEKPSQKSMEPGRPDYLDKIMFSYDATPLFFTGCFCICITWICDCFRKCLACAINCITCQCLRCIPCCDCAFKCCGKCCTCSCCCSAPKINVKCCSVKCCLQYLCKCIFTIVCCVPLCIIKCCTICCPKPSGCRITFGCTGICGSLWVCPYCCCGLCPCIRLSSEERAYWVQSSTEKEEA